MGYLERLRGLGLGLGERYIEFERDAWITMAVQLPHEIDSVIAEKHDQLDDPDMVRLHQLLSSALDWSADDLRIVEIADLVERLNIRAVRAGEEVNPDGLNDQFVAFLDATMVESLPVAKRLVAILEERGWKGWTRIEQVPTDRLNLAWIGFGGAARSGARTRAARPALAPALDQHPGLRPRTAEVYRSLLRRHSCHRSGDVQLGRLDTETIRERAQRAGAGVSKAMIAKRPRM